MKPSRPSVRCTLTEQQKIEMAQAINQAASKEHARVQEQKATTAQNSNPCTGFVQGWYCNYEQMASGQYRLVCTTGPGGEIRICP